MTYRVRFAERVEKDLNRLPVNTRRCVVDRIDALANDPRPRQAKPLHGSLKGRWRLRVGDYRVIYEIRDDVLVVLVISVGARSGVYGEMRRRR
jgi:mRNA interferase RelE/StbE